MGRRMRALASGLVIAALTLTMLGWLSALTEQKDSERQYAPFFAQQADYDVLFFGSSHIIYGVYPMELWEDYGIVSYNFGGHGIHIPTTYWVMKNALQYTKPRLVVIDCYLLAKLTKMFNNFSQVHQSFDVFPFSLMKVRAAFDLLKDSVFDAEFSGHADRTRSEKGLLWNFYQYHNRWSALGKDDFAPAYNVEKGAESFNVDVAVPRTSAPTDEVLEETVGMEYLRRMIRDCQQEGIDVLLVYLPFPPGQEERMEANTAGMIAREFGVDYIDYLDAGVVDYSTDCLDFWSHLNPSGARKVTDHLGQYIQERFAIPDRRDDPAYAGWYGDYETYTGYKLEQIQAQPTLKNVLVLLQDPHLSACLYLAESGLWQEQYRPLLENMGVDAGMLPAEGPALVVADRTNGCVSCLRPGETVDAGFGTAALVRTEDGAYSVRIDGREVMSPASEAVAGAVAIGGSGGQTAPAVQFSSGPEGETKITG